MRAPRTLRTALVAAGVTAALGVSATGALAAPGHTAEAVTTAASGSAHHQPKRVHVKTVKLADRVSTAKVYKTGKHHYQAEIRAEGVKYGTLYANGGTARATHNGLHVTLTANGKVTSWVERAKPKPRPKPAEKRVFVSSQGLADGASTAKIYRLSTDHYQADVFANGTRLATLDANGRAGYGENNGLHVALQPDGRLTSWVDETPTPAPTPTPTPDPDDSEQPLPGPAPTDPAALPDSVTAHVH
jgi:hypothetical protein